MKKHLMQSFFQSVRIKNIASYNDDVLPENLDPDSEIKYIEISDVDYVNGITNCQKLPFGKAPSRARRIVKEGDTIVSTVRTYLKAISFIDGRHNNSIASTGFAVFRPLDKNKTHPKYLSYCFQDQRLIGEIVSNSVGVSYPAINSRCLATLNIFIPSFSIQTQVANFLDHKTGQIDRLIAKKEELLKLLAEKRTAIITQAVTKGLNPNVEMKDSGIDWLGEIPKHWSVLKIKQLSQKVKTGTTPSSNGPDYFTEGEVNWYNPSDFRYDSIDLNESKRKIHENFFLETNLQKYPEGSVLVVGIGATLGKVGVVNYECYSNQQINAIYPAENYSSYYLAYVLASFVEILKVLSNATTLGIMNQEKTKNFTVPFPNIKEQNLIVDFIKSIDKKTEMIMTKTVLSINQLKEYREAIITAAVTGQIDVREEKTEIKKTEIKL